MNMFGPTGAFRDANGAWATGAFIALAFLMPLFPAVLPVVLVTGVVALLVRHRGQWQRPDLRTCWGTAMPWAFLLYVWHVLGMAWSTDMDYGAFDLQIKLPLAVLPLVFLLLPHHARQGWSTLFRPFIFGNAAAVLICMVALVYRLLTLPGAEVAQEVFGERFSFLVHPSYFALYLSVALAALYLVPLPGRMATWRTALSVLLVAGVIGTGSKAGWVGLPVVFGTLMWVCRNDPALRRPLFGMIGAAVVVGALLLVTSAGMRERVAEAWHAVTVDRAADATTSSEVRKLAWHSAVEVAKANAPWGTGTGDVKNELIAMHARNGYVHLVEGRINAHNEFLQLWAALGLPGLVLCCALVVVPFFHAVRRRNTLAGLFFLLCAWNWSVESMLEVQAGVLFFAFFAFILAMPDGQAGSEHTT